MERLTNSDRIEALSSPNGAGEEVQRILGHLGLYDASQDHYEVTEHPEDRKWAVEAFNNPCIELGED